MIAVSLEVEFTVEPFVEGAPGPHVQAAVTAAEQSGLAVEFGPFGTSVSGDDEDAASGVAGRRGTYATHEGAH